VTVRVETNGSVTTVVLARSHVRNAVDRATADALVAAFRAFEDDESAHVAVLYGEGGTFCSGADLRSFANGQGNRIAADGDGPMGPTRMFLSKPLIAAIEGHAVAGGLELALLADLRVVDESAIFGVFCRRVGVPLIDGGTIRLPRVIGLGRALDLILTGRPVDAEEARGIGLANRVVPKGTARAAAEALARDIARFPQATMRGDRRSAYAAFEGSIEDAMRREFAIGLESLGSGEAALGAEAFAGGKGRHGSFD
jgi:enoyl-CoA hydratase